MFLLTSNINHKILSSNPIHLTKTRVQPFCYNSERLLAVKKFEGSDNRVRVAVVLQVPTQARANGHEVFRIVLFSSTLSDSPEELFQVEV